MTILNVFKIFWKMEHLLVISKYSIAYIVLKGHVLERWKNVLGWSIIIVFGDLYTHTVNTWLFKFQNSNSKITFFIDFYTHIMYVGAIFTSPNHPKCKYFALPMIRACKNSPHNFELSRFYCNWLKGLRKYFKGMRYIKHFKW